MDKETLEMLIEKTEKAGLYEERAWKYENILDALIDAAKLEYNDKALRIDSDTLTAILCVYNPNTVHDKIAALKESRNSHTEVDE